jgi:hypothetical protein
MTPYRLLFPFLLLLAAPSLAQEIQFEGGLSGGLVLSQISGDNLSGFDQPGFSASGFVRITGKSASAFRLELGFIQKGSRKVPDPENGDYNEYKLRLNYFEMPILYEYRRNSLLLQGGLYLAFLTSWKEETQLGPLTILDENQEPLEFLPLDFGLALGCTYEVSERFFIAGRYTSSITPARRHPSGKTLSQALNTTFVEANRGQYNYALQFLIGVRLR